MRGGAMSADLTGGRNIAEYDWCWLFIGPCSKRCETDDDCDCIDEFLHAPDPALVTAFDDWDGDSIDLITACGRSGLMTIPGTGSRMSDPRCPQCCEATNLPPGIGSPKNDLDCRQILGMS